MRRPPSFGRFPFAGRIFVPVALLFLSLLPISRARVISPQAELSTAGFSKMDGHRRPMRVAATEIGVYELEGNSRIRVWPRDTIQGEATPFDGNDGSGRVAAFANAVAMKFVPGTNLLAVVDAKPCNGLLDSYPSIRFYEVSEASSGGILTGVSFRLAGLFGDKADTAAFGKAFQETFYPSVGNARFVYLDQATDIAFYGNAEEDFVVTFRDQQNAPESFLARFRGYEHPRLLSIVRLAKAVDWRIAPGIEERYSAGPILFDATAVAIDPDTGTLYVGSQPDATVYRFDAKSPISEANPYGERRIDFQEFSYQYEPIVTTIGYLFATLPDGSFKTFSTEEGEGNTLSSPGGFVLLKPAGFTAPLLLIADKGHDRVCAVDAASTLLFSFGGDGISIGKFRNPCDVALSADGKLAVADTSNGRIQLFSLSEDDIQYDETFIVSGILATFPPDVTNEPTVYLESETNVYTASISVVAGGTNRVYAVSGEPADVVTVLDPLVEIPAGEKVGTFRFKTISGSATGSPASITVSGYTSTNFSFVVTNVPPTFYSDYAYFQMTNGACTALGSIAPVKNVVYLGDTAWFAASAFDIAADSAAFADGNAYTWYVFAKGDVIPAPSPVIKAVDPALYEKQRQALEAARLPNGLANPAGWTSEFDCGSYLFPITVTNITSTLDPAMGTEVVETNIVDTWYESEGYQLWKKIDTVSSNGSFSLPVMKTGDWRIAVAVTDSDGATSCTLTERYWQYFQVAGRNPIQKARFDSFTSVPEEGRVDFAFSLAVAEGAYIGFTNAFEWCATSSSVPWFDPCATNEMYNLTFEYVEPVPPNPDDPYAGLVDPDDEFNYHCTGSIDFDSTLFPSYFRLLFLYE